LTTDENQQISEGAPMKKNLSVLFVLGIMLVTASSLLYAAKGTRSAVGIRTDWGTTKYLDELYALKLGWTIAFINKDGTCGFEKASWDEIDSESALFLSLLRESDLNKDNRVSRVEASTVLQSQKATLCRNAIRK
jgi:hypothetical protein